MKLRQIKIENEILRVIAMCLRNLCKIGLKNKQYMKVRLKLSHKRVQKVSIPRVKMAKSCGRKPINFCVKKLIIENST